MGPGQWLATRQEVLQLEIAKHPNESPCHQDSQSTMMLKETLSQLEERLRSLIEGGSARLFSRRLSFEAISQALVAAMRAGKKTQTDGQPVVPNIYTIELHPTDAPILLSDATILEELAAYLQKLADQDGLTFLSPPLVRVASTPQAIPGHVHVVTQLSIDNLAQTTDMVVETLPAGYSAPSNAYLVVDGTQIFPITQSVINIGRREDNHLVIPDGRVSRVHAQIRAIKGRYVIFDLDSRGGTYVNDQRIHECILYPGDVISLAGVPLVFGQDEAVLGETQRVGS